MPFRFTLEALLRYRKSLERRERLKLHVVTRELVQARRQQQEAEQDRAKAVRRLASALQEGLAGIELQFEQACDQTRVDRIARAAAQVMKLKDLHRCQVEAFSKAQQRRQVLDNLRARQFEAWRLAQARLAQRQLDERFLITRRTLSAESGAHELAAAALPARHAITRSARHREGHM